MAQDVFVSHASDDHAVAMQVCELLEQRGVRCWIAPRNVSAGAVWDEAILDAIEGAGVFLLILTARANESAFVKNEVNRAFADGKPIITFRVEDVMPGRSLQLYLARHHWTDAFPPPVEPHLDQLATSIGKLLNSAAEDSTTSAPSKPAASETIRKESPRPPPSPQPSAAKIGFRRRALLGAMLAGVTGGVATMWMLRPAPPPPAVTRSTFLLPEGQVLPSAPRHHLDISPDGTRMVYVADNRLYLRSLSEFEARPLPGSEVSGAGDPVFSPDGRSIVFGDGTQTDYALRRISINGGAIEILCQTGGATTGGVNWSPEGIVFSTNRQIGRVSADGGTPETLVVLKSEEQAAAPQMLPDGQTVLFSIATRSGSDPADWEKAKIVTQRVKSGERKVIIEDGTDAQYLPTGHLAFARDGVIFAVAFDANRLQTIGRPVPVVEGVKRSAFATRRVAQFRVSTNGTAIYFPGPASSAAGLLGLGLFDRKGPIELLKVPRGAYEHPRLSPDGQRIAFSSESGAIWIHDLSGKSAARRLTVDGQGTNRYPVWSADSQRVTFQSDREKDLGIFWQRADGAGAAERLVTAEDGAELVPEHWSPDGRFLLYCVFGKDKTSTLWVWSREERKAEPFGGVKSAGRIFAGGVFSPDGKWVAYTMGDEAVNRSRAVYIQPFPATGAKYKISKDTDDGHHPLWSPDGRELFFTPGPGAPLEAVGISTQPTFSFGESGKVTRRFLALGPMYPRPWDMSRDGQRFLGLSEAQADGSVAQDQQIRVVVNWFEELKRKVPVK